MKTIAAAVIATAALSWGLLAITDDTSHACVAPCVVSFSEPTPEDAYHVDYRSGGTLTVTHQDPA